jgi:dimethylglycine dehydrogenase
VLPVSGGYSHRVGMSLALAYLHADVPVDAKRSASILAETFSAEILERIPYDPTNARMRS